AGDGNASGGSALGGQPPAGVPAQQSRAQRGNSVGTSSAGPTLESERRSYYNAIDNLAFLSSLRQGSLITLLLMLGALGGTLGLVLRSLVDFVGNASYKGELDLRRWWPLYVTRPIVGAILGFVLVVLFKAQLLTGGELPASDSSFWWLGIAFIGGFST